MVEDRTRKGAKRLNLEAMYNILEEETANRRQQNAEWNKENPPDKEIDIVEDGITTTVGFWKAEDGGIYMGFKTKNVEVPYYPASLQLLQRQIVTTIKSLSDDN
jgi:hypothetical protein